MSTNTHITGDRSNGPAYGALAAVAMLRAVSNGETISTGDTEKGVDALVKALGDAAGVEVLVAGSVPAKSSVVFIHSDPHASSRLKAFLEAETAGEFEVRISTHADLMV